MEDGFWGYHLRLDISGCDFNRMIDRDNVDKFARHLVQDIDMVPYGDPQIVNFGTGSKEGFTLIQLIETSNICAHFANESQAIYLDVFSCKKFDISVVKALVRLYFKPTQIKEDFAIRQA